jgi:hypothetical protein
MIEDNEIQNIIARSANIGDACRELIAKANEHGGEDNITAVVIKIEDHADGASSVDVTGSTGQMDAASPASDGEPGEPKKEGKKTRSGETKKAAAAAAAAANTEKPAAQTVIHSGASNDDSAAFAEEPTMPGIGIGPLPTPDAKPKK